MANVDSLYVMGMSLTLKETKPKTTMAKHGNTKNTKIEKIYTISGQAPSPSKDYFELIVARDRVIWRVWHIKYKHSRKILPSEENLSHEEFQNDGRLHRDITKTFGDDVLHIALAYASKEWLARVPQAVLQKIISYLGIKDICMLSTVCDTLRIRCQDNKIWRSAFLKTFGAWDDLRERRAKKIGWKNVFAEEWQRKRVNKIDWDTL